MSAKQVQVEQVPSHIKPILLIHQNPRIIRIFECTTKEDICDLALQFPLETTAMRKINGAGVVEGYYIVGISIPNATDEFRYPVLCYYLMNDSDFRQFGSDIKKEIERRKQVYEENKAALKDIRNSR